MNGVKRNIGHNVVFIGSVSCPIHGNAYCCVVLSY